jgi:hypothetical protein
LADSPTALFILPLTNVQAPNWTSPRQNLRASHGCIWFSKVLSIYTYIEGKKDKKKVSSFFLSFGQVPKGRKEKRVEKYIYLPFSIYYYITSSLYIVYTIYFFRFSFGIIIKTILFSRELGSCQKHRK